MPLKRRDEIEASEGRDILRLAKSGGSSLLYTAVVLVAVIVVLAVSVKLNRRYDVSLQGTNALSAQSKSVIEGVTEPVKLYALMRKNPRDRWETYWNLLMLYRRGSDRIEAEIFDPVARPGIIGDLGLDPDQEAQRLDGMTVLVQGDHTLPLDDTARTHVFRGMTEEDVTNALLEVGRQEERIVGILRGYGERDPESEEAGGFAAAVAALRQEYYQVRDVWLSDGIPDDVLVLLAPGPQQRMSPEDLDVLREWLRGGGRLMVMVDPGEDTEVSSVLEEWGLRTTDRRITDPRENIRRDPRFLRVTKYSPAHEAVKGFGANLPTAYADAIAVEHFEADSLLFHDGLAATSPFAVAFDDTGVRTTGPFPVAAAAWRPETVGGEEVETRIVLVGDSDFASQAFLPTNSNRNFLLNCVAWLSRADELITVRRPQMGGQTYSVQPGDRLIVGSAVLGAPVLLTVLGFGVWIRRRRL
jgi:hypothetical protein